MTRIMATVVTILLFAGIARAQTPQQVPDPNALAVNASVAVTSLAQIADYYRGQTIKLQNDVDKLQKTISQLRGKTHQSHPLSEKTK